MGGLGDGRGLCHRIDRRPLFVRKTEELLGRRVATGEFGAMMEVALVNDAPARLAIEGVRMARGWWPHRGRELIEVDIRMVVEWGAGAKEAEF